MATTSKWSKKRALLAVTLPLALLAAVVLAGSSSTTLPNGADLTVEILDPETSTEFQVPVGETTIDVDVTGQASVGLGEPDATLVYVIDVSGSTIYTSAGGDCGGDVNNDGDSNTVLDCEAAAVLALNAAATSGGSVDEVGVAVYGETGAAADMTDGGADDPITIPGSADVATVVRSVRSSDVAGEACDNAGVSECTPKAVGCDGTDFSAGLAAAKTVVDASGNSHNLVVFLSDGRSNEEEGAGFAANLDSLLATKNAVIYSFAVGESSSCEGGSDGTLQQMADQSLAQNGAGACEHVTTPAELPDILPQLIGTALESLEIAVNGGPKQTFPADMPLPQDGPIGVGFTTTVTDLGPDDHTICVTANGSDVTGGVADVTQCETIHLLQLAATPPNEVNDLNFDDQHTVTAEVFGGSGPDRDIDFVVGGQNAATATPAAGSILASVNVPVDFVYTVPQDCASLGLDTITVSALIAGLPAEIEVTKEWIDTVPPEVSCDPSVNPHGNEPNAPGHGGQQNADGFYQLNAEDPYLANCTVTLLVFDGDGFVFPGPFLPGDNIKYTQSDGRPQRQKKIGSTNGQAGQVRWHLQGHGDLTVTGTDPSGNSSSAVCLVPPPPM